MVPVEVNEKFLRRQPLIQVSGVAININRDDKLFDVDAVQYVYAMKTIPRDNVLFPSRAYFPDSARFQNSKPMPSKDSCVSFRGLITRIGLSPAGVLERFFIEIDQLSFLGKKGAAPFECAYLIPSSFGLMELIKALPVPTTPSPSRVSKLKFSFDAGKSPRPLKRQRQAIDAPTSSQDPAGETEEIEYIDLPKNPS